MAAEERRGLRIPSLLNAPGEITAGLDRIAEIVDVRLRSVESLLADWSERMRLERAQGGVPLWQPLPWNLDRRVRIVGFKLWVSSTAAVDDFEFRNGGLPLFREANAGLNPLAGVGSIPFPFIPYEAVAEAGTRLSIFLLSTGAELSVDSPVARAWMKGYVE